LTERDVLGSVNHELVMNQVMALANRGNTSFYPIDPRGLAVFDDPDKVLGASSADMEQDRRNLSKRLSALRELADGTDGLAIVNTNSLDAGLRRIVDDLSSYYLLSYASSGPLDGKFHSICLSDRSGKPLSVPLEPSVRTGEGGLRWTGVSLSLAPLGTGDYLVEFATPGERVMLPLKVVP
jgi:VWFA-related protein